MGRKEETSISMEEGIKNKPLLTNKELNKVKKPRMSVKSINCGREGAETAKGIL